MADTFTFEELAAPETFEFEDLIEEPEEAAPPEPIAAQFPTLPEQATLKDVLGQPPVVVQPQTGVVRSVLPGVLQPEDLLPSVRLIGGEQKVGMPGDTHPDIIADYNIPAVEIDQRGFQGPTGEFFPREEAAIGLGPKAQTAREPTRLHSTDLSALQGPGGFEKQLENVAKAELTPEPLVKLGELPPELRRLYAAPVRWIGGEKAGGVAESVIQTLYDSAKSVPEFLTTEEGMLAALASMTPLGRAGVEAYFTVDMAKSLLDQAKSAGEDWDKLSAADKASRITQAAVTLGFIGLLSKAGIGTGKKIAERITRPAGMPPLPTEPVPPRPTPIVAPPEGMPPLPTAPVPRPGLPPAIPPLPTRPVPARPVPGMPPLPTEPVPAMPVAPAAPAVAVPAVAPTPKPVTAQKVYHRGTTRQEWENIKAGRTSGAWVTPEERQAQLFAKKKGEQGVVITWKTSANEKLRAVTTEPFDVRRKGDLGLSDVQRVTDANGNVIYKAPTEPVAPKAVVPKIPTAAEVAAQTGTTLRATHGDYNIYEYRPTDPNLASEVIRVKKTETDPVGFIQRKIKESADRFKEETKPTTPEDSAKEAADEIGFTLSPEKQIGSMKLTGLTEEQISKLRAAGQTLEYEFTDKRPDSPTKGITFYVPEGATKQQILDAYKAKIAEFEKTKKPTTAEPTSTAPAAPAAPPSTSETSLTSMQRRYREVKNANPDSVVLMRIGDFYEAFWEDAKTLNEVTKAALTKRNNVPMAGVPYHAVRDYVAKLEASGKKVFIDEGTRAPAAPTPAPAESDVLFDSRQPSRTTSERTTSWQKWWSDNVDESKTTTIGGGEPYVDSLRVVRKAPLPTTIHTTNDGIKFTVEQHPNGDLYAKKYSPATTSTSEVLPSPSAPKAPEPAATGSAPAAAAVVPERERMGLSWSSREGGKIMGAENYTPKEQEDWIRSEIKSLQEDVKFHREEERRNREAYKTSPNRRVMGGLAPESLRAAGAKGRKLEAQNKIEFLKSQLDRIKTQPSAPPPKPTVPAAEAKPTAPTEPTPPAADEKGLGAAVPGEFPQPETARIFRAFNGWTARAKDALQRLKEYFTPPQVGALPEVEIQSGAILPRLPDYAKEKVIASEPHGLAKVPGLGALVDTRAVAHTPADAAFLARANSISKGKTFAALWAQTQWRYRDLFYVESEGLTSPVNVEQLRRGKRDLQMREPTPKERAVLSDLSQRTYAEMEALASAERRGASQDELSQLRSRVSEARQAEETAMRSLQRPEQPNAPSGLQPTTERRMGVQEVSPAAAPGTFRLANGQRGYLSDVIEAELRDPGSQPLSYDQWRWIHEEWKPVLEEVRRMLHNEGVQRIALEDMDFDLATDYFPRPAIGKRNRPATGAGGRPAGRPGAKQFFQKERKYPTEEEGARPGTTDAPKEEIIYDPDPISRVTKFISGAYRSIADHRLANDPALGAGTVPDYWGIGRRTMAGPAFAGKIYPVGVAEKIERQFAQDVRGWVRSTANATSAAKALMATADLSGPFIQGAAMMARNPVRWVRSTLNSYRALTDPVYLARLMEHPRYKELAEGYSQSGGSLLQLQDFLAGLREGQIATRIPGYGRILTATGRAYGAFLDLAKLELYDAWRQATPPSELPRLVETIENSLFMGRMEQAGMNPHRAIGERLLLFAPSYYRGAGGLIATAFQKGVSGKMARQMLGSYAAASLLVSLSAYMALGMDWDEIRERLQPGRGKFLKIPISLGDGERVEVGIGNILTQLVRLAGQAANYHTSNKPIDTGVEANPYLRFLRGRSAFLPGVSIELATGRDYFGNRITAKESIARHFAPFVFQSMFPRDEASFRQRSGDSIFTFFGLNAYPESEYEKARNMMDATAHRMGGKPFSQLNVAQRARVVAQFRQSPDYKRREPTPTDMERIIHINAERQANLQQALGDSAEKLARIGLKVPGYRSTIHYQGVDVPMTESERQRYQDILAEMYRSQIDRLNESVILKRPLVSREKWWSDQAEKIGVEARKRLAREISKNTIK